MRLFFQRLVRLQRVLRQQGRRAALKVIGRHLGSRFDLATTTQVEAIAATLSRLGDENRLLREQLTHIEHSVEQSFEALCNRQYRNSQSIRWLADHHGNTGLPVHANGRGHHAVGMAATRVSVIMPTWNRAATIRNAIQSVLDQTYESWELLIVDDGSHDDTRAVVSRYRADRRIRYLEQPHTGACAARNLGLRHASGDLIAYLDSDNVWYAGYLESVVRAFVAAPQEKCSYAALLIVNPVEGEAHIQASPYNRRQLEECNQIDLNVFAHRLELYDRLGGFDESLTRLQDWDLILRYTEDSPPLALPLLGARYYAGRPDSISAREPLSHSLATIRRKHQPRITAPLKVLYALWHYPQLSETYIETEIRYVQRRGVDVAVWSEVAGGGSPYPTTVPIYHGSLAEAIEQVRPHLVHVHWLGQALNCADTVHAAGLKLTARGHGFEVTPEVITSLEQHPATAAIYLFPHFAGENLHLRPKIRPMISCFNPDLYAPGAEKDPRLVVRAACALPGKDVQTFLRVAQLCPEHHFILALVTARGMEGYVDEMVGSNQSLGSPVDVQVNLPFPQIASLVQRAGIFLHTHGLIAPYGMPISIAESMATGCYVIARRCPAAETYVGPAGRLYDTADEAAALVRETLTWNHDRWQQVRRTAMDHSFHNYVDSTVLPPLLDEWLRIAGEAADCEPVERRASLDIIPFPQQPDAQAVEDSRPPAFRLVA